MYLDIIQELLLAKGKLYICLGKNILVNIKSYY